MGRGRAEETPISNEETDGERRAAFMPITSTDGEMETATGQQAAAAAAACVRAERSAWLPGFSCFDRVQGRV